MKKLAASSLALALWMEGSAQAQSPFFQPAPQPIQPVAATTPAAPVPPGGFIPVRVHFGGALTQNGIVPVEAYLNQPVAPARFAPAPRSAEAAAPAGNGVYQLTSAGADAGSSAPARPVAPTDVFVNNDACAPTVTDPRFVPPNPDDMHRPYPAPCGYRWYTVSEYLHWWGRRQESPVLLVAGDTLVTADSVDKLPREGGRYTLGHWLDTCHPWAIEGTFLFLTTHHSTSAFAGNGVVPIFHPFTDADTGLPDSIPVATMFDLAPRTGASAITTSSRILGFEANARRELFRNCHGHFDFLFGYRQLQLDETIDINDRIAFATAPQPLSGATVTLFDDFGTHNKIMGGQVGFEGEFNWRRFYVDGWGKFAMGDLQEVINISGATQIRATPGEPPPPDILNGKTFVGGIFSQASNIGRFERDRFSVMPEVGVNVGCALTSNIRVGAGYNFLYLNNVVRPGDAIDTTLSRNQIPILQPFATTAGAHPAPPTFVESSYWAHGITVEMEIRY